ncbi:hypothetical protein SAY87_021105 [Trapa incisa]|uniref:Gnk2-homologous domain-containing protein n=1 Tax=Trapa incisa TaxID=236973 RepID=A0AAN7JRN2_9MYRT|nr:hypothetical protein SAY87_021105 [Trapa incisa]
MQRDLHRTRTSFLSLSPLFFHLLFDTVGANVYVYSGCSQEKYQQGSPFEANLNSFLSSSVSSSTQTAYNSFALGNGTGAPPEAFLFGMYQCRGDLKIADCSKCIQGAVNQLNFVCPYSYGASLQLEGCYVRYEHIDFLGKSDTNLRFKKCSKRVSSDVEFFRRRDDVLTDLKGAAGFRVSSSGLVEGFAQCMGDLSAADCSACLVEAVDELKTLCGSAAASDVFLGQCYARYWASGYYGYSSDSPRQDGVGKTVAVIVGSVAGLAVIIVLLSLCRKAMG